MAYKCDICKDDKHVFTPEGYWVRCTCLEQEMLNDRLIKAQICYPKDSLNFPSIQSQFPLNLIDSAVQVKAEEIQAKFKDHKKPLSTFCFQGSATGPKDMFVQTILLTAVESNCLVRQITMEELVASQFEDGPNKISVEQEFKKSEIFCLSFGMEPQFKMGAAILQNIVRMSKMHAPYLILHTHLKWDDLAYKYGDSTQNLFVPSSQVKAGDQRIVFYRVEE